MPDNLTPRLWIKYTSANFEHEMLLRPIGPPDAAAAVTWAQPLLQVLKILMLPTDEFFDARYSAAGSDISLPVFQPLISGTGSSGLSQGDPQSHYVNFIGRGTASGAKARWTLFTASGTADAVADNRYNPGDNAAVDQAIAAFQARAAFTPGQPFLATADGDAPQVYSYANSGWNYHWLKKQRA